MRIEVLAAKSTVVLAAWVECVCCKKLVLERDADVIEQDTGSADCCIPCILFLDGYGDSDPGPGLPSQLSYESFDDGWTGEAA